MSMNEALEEALEAFQGDVRKLDELISQLELWSDECTINHKKEEIRLPQYIELHLNLEELKEQLDEEINALGEKSEIQAQVEAAKAHIQQQLASYKETEQVIHDWIREIKNIYVLINSSRVLEQNKEYLNTIIEA